VRIRRRKHLFCAVTDAAWSQLWRSRDPVYVKFNFPSPEKNGRRKRARSNSSEHSLDLEDLLASPVKKQTAGSYQLSPLKQKEAVTPQLAEKKAVVKHVEKKTADSQTQSAAKKEAVKKKQTQSPAKKEAIVKKTTVHQTQPAGKKAVVEKKTAVKTQPALKKAVVEQPALKKAVVEKKTAVQTQPAAKKKTAATKKTVITAKADEQKANNAQQSVLFSQPAVKKGTTVGDSECLQGRLSATGHKTAPIVNGHASGWTSPAPESPNSTKKRGSNDAVAITDGGMTSSSLTNGSGHANKIGLTYRRQTDGGSWTKHFKDLSGRANSCSSPQLNSCPSSPATAANLIERHKLWLMSPGSRPADSPLQPLSPPKKKIQILQSIAYK
jgi:hypothetical protein